MSDYQLNLNGLEIGINTLIITIFLEIISFNHTLKLLKNYNNRILYFKSIIMNIINNLIIGPFLYILCQSYIINTNECLTEITFVSMKLILLQSIGYYSCHYLMHTKYLYFIHRFHHKYNNIIIPISANSVSILEYLFAYMLPFVCGIYIFQPNELSLKLTIYLISIFNLLIHTPSLEKWSHRMYPKFLVSTSDHFIHHRLLKTKYSAPILNWDYINSNIILYIKKILGY